VLKTVDKQAVLERLPERTAAHYEEFYTCADCGKVYWKGSHYERMKKNVRDIARGVNLDGQEDDPRRR
jgi:hypothetical protein